MIGFKISKKNGIKKYKFLGISIFSLLPKDDYVDIFIGKFKYRKFTKKPEENLTLEQLIEYNSKFANKTLLFFDLSLGGGTESYFYNKVKILRENNLVLRIQYLNDLALYKLSLYDNEHYKYFYIKSLDALTMILKQLNLSEIIINNLVGYPNLIGMLGLIGNLKNPSTKVSARGHDFYPICPSYTLMNDCNEFCNLPDAELCENCFSQKNKVNNVMSLEDYSISFWRNKWNQFFSDSVDELIVFSQSSYDIFTRIYPVLTEKTQIILHEVLPLRKVEVENHKDLNIAVLGNINSTAKGENIVRDLEYLCDADSSTNLFVIGSYNNELKTTKVTGEYNRADLADIIEDLQIDIIFIPSVWPETFSYTTSEAIEMNIPVACFNFGAPLERVGKYEKGLIINEVSAKAALESIKQYLNNKRSGNEIVQA